MATRSGAERAAFKLVARLEDEKRPAQSGEDGRKDGVAFFKSHKQQSRYADRSSLLAR